ncbi:MAG: T9SS type A sorting domain-containing protein [Ignavibacteriales bacterium]|nr:T9SS type A sorting domain-containing protein [Ignavibacteriales bacterium]
MNSLKVIALFALLFTCTVLGQLYQGPASGSVASGVTVTTGTFGESQHLTTFRPKPIKNIFAFVLTKDFQALPDQGFFIPPDPYLAVGAQEIMALVNSRFAIMNKSGVISKTIEGSTWYNSTLSGADPFDPKVIYDHYAKRWIMVWLNVNSSSTVAYFLVSVSDDSIAAGTWYNWKLPTTVNGSTAAGNWADYQGVGYDQNAIYITSNQFTAAGSFNYSKIRIIPKSDLYANTAGQVTWKDLWDIRHPDGTNPVNFGLRPARMTGNSSEYYLLGRSPFVTGTYVTLYKVTNPLTTPVLTAVNVPVTAYSDPADMGQLGSTNTIDGGSSNLRNEPFFKDGKLYAVHTVRSGTGNAFSAVRLIGIDVTTNTVSIDKAMGVDNYWHSYPALSLDGTGNIALTYSRGGTTEYVGAYYTTYPVGATAMTGSKLVKAGAGTYYKTFGGSRNRWGDYNGAWTDPSDPSKVYVMTEYVRSTNNWGSWIGELSFSTTAASVTVTAPNGSEIWAPGSSQNITWMASNIANVKIELTTNNGTAWTTVAASVSGTTGSYSWTVPNTPATQCKIKITDVSNAAVSDVTDGLFTIGQPPTQGWEAVTSGTTGDIWGIDYLDANNVWISSSTGDVKKSTDAGATFTAAGNAGEGAYSIAVLNPTTAVVALGPSAGDGKLMRTTNGGTTWTQVYSVAGCWFNFVDNVDANNLWALSDPIGGVFHIVKSTDGGVTWTLTSNRPTAPASTVFGANNSWYAVGNTFWFGTGGQTGATLANKVYRSVNGADGPWTIGTTTAQFTGALAFSSGTGNGLVGFWQATNTMNKTTNGGTSFTALTTTNALTHGLDYVPGTSVAYAASSTGLFKTTNDGTSWTSETLPAGTTGEMLFVRLFNSGAQGMVGGQAGVLLRKVGGAPVASVTVVSPNGGETWAGTSQKDITWTSSNVGTVKIEYTSNNGTTWNTIAASVPATPAVYSWTVPNIGTTQAKVRISDGANSATSDVSNATFTITQTAIITWQHTINIKDNGIDNKDLVFGQSPQATDGMDALLGELPLPPVPPAGVFDARFELPVTPADYSLKDFRNDTVLSASWVAKFQAGTGYPITLTWNAATLPVGNFALKDMITGTLVNVNMKSVSSYVLTNTGITALKIEYTRSLCRDISLAAGWNIVSVPLVSSGSMATAVLFPAATSPAYGYNNNYVLSTVLETSKGYFLRYGSQAVVNVCGVPPSTRTLSVKAGWNIVGAFELDALVSALTTTPANIISSPFYGYSGGYQQATSLNVGKGYWVRASAAGTINLPALAAKSGDAIAAAPVDKEWGKIVIADAAGNTSTLYVANKQVQNPSLYDLPPVPPSEVFDARFSSSRFVDQISTNLDVLLNGAVYPVDVTVVGADLRLSDKATSGKLVSADVRSGGTVRIINPGVQAFTVENMNAVLSYELFQNYPNPFNPSTTIKYSVPEKAMVELAIYDQLGQVVSRLVNEVKEAGTYEVEWNASHLTTGVYFYKVKTEKFSAVKKLMLVK